jgi:hypothetical protein
MEGACFNDGFAFVLANLKWMNMRENCAKKALRFAYRSNLSKFWVH